MYTMGLDILITYLAGNLENLHVNNLHQQKLPARSHDPIPINPFI